MVETSSPSRGKNSDLILAVLFLAIGLVVFELWMATTRHDNSRDQHLGGAVAFAKGHIDIMRPMLLGYNANGVPTPLEFPVWQAVTAIFMKCFGIWYGWGNVTSLIFFFSSLLVLFDLCRRTGSVRLAWWAVLFALCQPLSVVIGGQAGGDSTAWSFAMWFIYFAYRMLNEGRWGWWFLAVFSGCLSAAAKAPFFMTAGLTTFFWLWTWYRRSVRAWLFLASSGIISGAFLIAWNYHCHLYYKQAEFPFENMDTFHGSIYEWYFGTLAFRLNIHNWVRLCWHTMIFIFGVFGILIAPLSIRFKQSRAPWLWILAAVVTTLVFPVLVCNHDHYIQIYAPVIAWLCAIVATEIEPAFWSIIRASIPIRFLLLCAAYGTSIFAVSLTLHATLFDTYQQDIGQEIHDHTSPNDKLVVWGEIWGKPFLRADREGLTAGSSLTDNAWFNDPKNLNRLRELGYTKIVLMNPSPFMVAWLSVNLGGTAVSRADLHQDLPEVAKKWPVAYDSPQLLIVQIPNT